MSFDLAASLRRLKPEKRRPPLRRRSDADLVFVEDVATAGPGLLYDTTVYIDALQGRRPDALKAIMAQRTGHHSAIALAELTHSLGRLDPDHPGTRDAFRGIAGVIETIPDRRLDAPSTRALAEAGMAAGMVARLRGLPRGALQALLNDAALFCQAAEYGLTLVTRNVADVDLIQQIAPLGHVLFYRQAT